MMGKSLQVLEHKQLHSTVFGVQYWRVQSRHACEKKRDYDLPSCTTVVYNMTFAPPVRESPLVKNSDIYIMKPSCGTPRARFCYLESYALLSSGSGLRLCTPRYARSVSDRLALLL